MEPNLKQAQFNAAIELFNTRPVYKVFGIWISLTNILLQLYLFYRVTGLSISWSWQIAAFVAAYLLADFINGLVHLYMDQCDDYCSLFGPLVANFHLHHKHPLYKKNPLLIVYFNETGSKIWLVFYLLVVVLLFDLGAPPQILFILVYIGILSSVAEVSHYLCHSSNSSLARLLASAGLLLSKRHHAKHHLQDNVGYAFLNGFTDPLINRIAAKYSKGYKQHTDLHYAVYNSLFPENRTRETIGAAPAGL